MFKAAVLWNPVINLSSVFVSNEIPDWATACCLNKDLDYVLTPEENTIMYNKSPYSAV